MSSSVISAAGKSHLTECTSTSSFKELHNGYTRRLLNGRHPRSFPKQSELWVHYRSSNKRLERISKGHRLWYIVDNQDTPGEDWDEDWESDDPRDTRSNSDEAPPPSTGGLKDLGVDLEASTKLHYGMVIVIVNSNEELVCVNEFNETMVKRLEQMTPKDHFLFKLVDLGDPTYPGPLVYSRPVWLQIFKRGAVDNSMQFGQLIGGKLYAPPTMTSAQLEEQARVAAMKEAEQDRLSRSVIGGSGPKDSHDSAAPRRTARSIDDDDGFDDWTSSATSRRARSRSIASVASAQAPDQPDVCGGISVINIMGGKSHGAEKTDEAGSRHRTRSSWHLGQWIVRNATRKEVSDKRRKSEQIASDANVYLEQDLYCLASSAGSSFAPWPKRAHSPHSERYRKKAERMNPAKSDKDMFQAAQAPTTELMSQFKDVLKSDENFPDLASVSNSSIGNRPGTPDSGMTSLSSLMPVLGSSKNKDKSTIQPECDVYGCLRKVVLRGPPYLLIVDRKCVWRLCPANNFGDTNELSAKERIAHKLLRSAEEGLEKSRQGREGARVHEQISIDGHPLYGGEKFPKQLRSILSEHGFNKESQQLNLRRKQEKLIESHFQGLYGDGRGWPERDKQFPSPLPKPSRHSPPTSPTDSFYITSGLTGNSCGLSKAGGDGDVNGRTSGSAGPKLTRTYSTNLIKGDNTYGADMLKLHKSLHVANVKLIGTLSSPNPPSTPFTATFGYAGDIQSASVVLSSASGAARGVSSVSRRHDSGDTPADRSIGTNKNGSNNIETALAMGRMAKRLEKLTAVDEVVNQALRHRERIAKYGRIAAVFKNLATNDQKMAGKNMGGEKLFIPDINIDGYDPTCGT